MLLSIGSVADVRVELLVADVAWDERGPEIDTAIAPTSRTPVVRVGSES